MIEENFVESKFSSGILIISIFFELKEYINKSFESHKAYIKKNLHISKSHKEICFNISSLSNIFPSLSNLKLIKF